MKTPNSVLMKQARESLAGKWGLAIGVSVLYLVISFAIQMIPKAGPILSLLVSGPMTLGLVIFSLALSRNNNPRLEQMFEGFRRIGVSIAAYLLMTLFVLLWFILLIIPGLIASLAYSMTFFVIAEDPNIGAREAIRKSKKMMHGYKWKFFCLQLRFIGWALLCILTLGIGFLWLNPYIQISTAKFYEDIKNTGAVPVVA